MSVKKLILATISILAFLLIGFILLIIFYNAEKQVKVSAGAIHTLVDKKEVTALFGNAYAAKASNKVLGEQTPLEVEKTEEVKKTDFSFNAIAATWKEDTPAGTDVAIQIRTSKDGQNWSDWQKVEEDEDGNAKDGTAKTKSFGRLITVEGEYIQQRLIFKTDNLQKVPQVKELDLTYIDSKEKLNFVEKILKSVKLGVKEAFAVSNAPNRPTDTPSICSRSCWGAYEGYRTWGPGYSTVKKMVVHHTVTTNSDPDPKATIRAIYYFHAVGHGWGDIGYNFIVDQNSGTIYEGRYGGDSVIGAHALGYNTGSVGVSVLGDFRYVSPNNKVQNALHKIIVWKFHQHDIDPDKSSSFGNPTRWLPSVFYHGFVGNTSCAGTYLNVFVSNLRTQAHYMPQQIVLKDSYGPRLVTSGNEKTVTDLLNIYRKTGTVAPNYIRGISAFPSDGSTPPDDPNYSSQWDLAKVEAPDVWRETSGGDPSVKVAVLDTGVAYEDYDPPGSAIYAKGPDFENTNFVAGYDYVNNDSHPNDDHGHGTAVASVIAESTDNNLGSASLAYNVSIIPVKVCDRDGWCLDSDVAQGIDFARTNGAKVINMSIGGPNSSSVIQSAITSAGDAGLVQVAASGNDGTNNVSFPGRASSVIGVGALTSSDTRASYSNYGSGLDIMAPGGNGSGGSGDLLYQILDCTGLDCRDFSYSRIAGTSFSTPLVSASAALLIGKGLIWPESVARFLMLKANDLGAANADSVYGWGRVNPFDALALSVSKPHDNGVLVKTSNSGKIYLVEDGKKRWIPSREIFERGYNWDQVVSIASFEASSYTNGSDVGFPAGALLQGSDQKVYVLENGQKRWITSREIFDELGYKFGQVIGVSDSLLAGYTTGSNLSSLATHPDGSLITSTSTNKIYLIDGGQRRWVPSRGIFESRYFFKYVLNISQSKLEGYSNGTNVTYADGSLIKDKTDPNQKIYLVTTETGSSSQTKSHLVSRITFLGLGYNWENVRNDGSSNINVFSSGPTIY